MKKALLLHSSREGQTVKILRFIENELSDQYQCELVDLHAMPDVNLDGYDKVLIGASIRYGHLNKKLYQYIEKNLTSLNQSKAAFFCVNLTARKPGKDTPEGSVYVKKFLRLSPWQPEVIGVFAGALYYPRYRLFDRVMIQFIMRITGGETDTTKEVEYTNWDKVKEFSEQFGSL
ncbi:menaquinone-dependent protoporphyrinogen IX dehydrogenase [Enterovibrio nigricans]|uniref:Protoporphyrinogen IX dehydrogenase [quinone] n=1 Tax=Enterovibrio nigricans DSM 22720 TaxID=1121868 RepID=A0A1T4VFC7_9GAMM|nr:menaquinone-dependent protoporphyrinogen IX dehydrogenase [Enterovibrio nigricans]PKF49814.1 menaquinone-dependent protoporphyrinogen IX dehydrogenase [Enterovibrio nigricans]SKA63617.1 menaquinone-dependent protoporphyrinogen oxidase [Enterovibrio nigricans DSM 22720]